MTQLRRSYLAIAHAYLAIAHAFRPRSEHQTKPGLDRTTNNASPATRDEGRSPGKPSFLIASAPRRIGPGQPLLVSPVRGLVVCALGDVSGGAEEEF